VEQALSDLGQTRNDLMHVGALVLWAVCASATVTFLGTLLSGYATQRFRADLAEKAAAQGRELPVSFAGFDSGSLYVWSVFAAVVAVASGFGAAAMWRAARVGAQRLSKSPPPGD
jgi:hypothetical protein